MAGESTPGPVGICDDACWIDEGTNALIPTPTPGPVCIDESLESAAPSANVGTMDAEDRFIEVLHRTVPRLPGEIQDEFAAMLTPLNLGIMAAVLIAWGASHYFGVGFIVDAILLVGGVVFLGWQVFAAAGDLIDAVKITMSAKSEEDLDRAAIHLANFIAVVGVAAFMALVMKGGKKLSAGARAGTAGATASRVGGIVPRHVDAFRKVALEMNRIIAVRGTNPRSLQWIQKGFPPKGMDIKIKTSKQTGIVTAVDDIEVRTARQKGYYVVDEHGVPRNTAGEALDIGRPEWPLEKGQVIHPRQKKPLVGDYDLQGVIDPNAPGRNIGLVASEGKRVDNVMSPDVRKVAEKVNTHFDQPRVLHGADDQFLWNKTKDPLPNDDVLVVFSPDGSVTTLDRVEDVRAFYESLGRQTLHGKY